MNELALFAGAGGGILGGALLGWRTVCAVEIDKYAASVLLARQNDGVLAPFPIWDDVRTFDGKPWRGIVDIVSGGFPCQDISVAGKGVGINGPKSGLWHEMARIVREVRPQFVFVENSPALTGRGLGVVLGDLAKAGYDAEWCVLGADDVGAPHKRKRIWILAHANCSRRNAKERREIQTDTNQVRHYTSSEPKWHTKQQRIGDDGHDVPNANSQHCQKQRRPSTVSPQNSAARCSSWWLVEPYVGRVVDGLASRVDRVRLKALGNGQVPAVAATAFRLLLERFY